MRYEVMASENLEDSSTTGSRAILIVAVAFFAACMVYTVATVIGSGAFSAPIEPGHSILAPR